MYEISYSVEFHIETGVSAMKCKDKAEAISIAKNTTDDPSIRTYVTFYRASDGQKGYVNPNGDYELYGVDWNCELHGSGWKKGVD